MIVLVFEERDRQEVEERLGPQSYPSSELWLAHYEMSGLCENFKTLEEVEIWWEDK